MGELDQPALPPARNRIALTVLAWCVIAACVTLIVTSGLRPRKPELLTAEADPRRVAGTELLIQSRLALGMRQMMRGATNAPGVSPVAPVLVGIDQTARRSPVASLRAVTVAGEINGADAALKRLDALDSQALPAALQADSRALRVVYTKGPDALDAGKRDNLVARHGWFARLALVHGKPDNDPDRHALLTQCTRATWAVFILFGVGAVALVVGVALIVLALVRYFDGRLRFAYVPPPPGRDGPFVEAFAIYMAGMVLVSVALVKLLGEVSLSANFWITAAVPLAALWPRLRGLSWAEVRAGFGWHRGRGWLREIASGFAGYVAGLPLLAAAVVVTSLLARWSGTTPSHPIVNEAAGSGLFRVFQLYLLAAVYAPLAEETMFRGALYHHVRRLPWWLSAVVVGLIFAAIHPQGWVGIPMLTTIALVLAALREWRGSVVAPVVAHACVNGVTVTMLVVMTGS